MSTIPPTNNQNSQVHEPSSDPIPYATTNDIMDSTIQDSNEFNFPAESINRSTYESWSVDEVINWCIPVLNIEKDDALIINITCNGISGDVLNDLTFDDCKELCNNSLPETIRFRIALNKLKENSRLDKKFEEQEENMTIVLKNLYVSLNSKLQDYSNQYSRLRMELLEVVKNRSATSTQGLEGSQTEFFEVPKSQPTLTTNMTPNLSRRNTNSNKSLSPITQSPTTRSPTTQSFQPTQLRNRSTSSLTTGAQQPPLISSSIGKPKLSSANSSSTIGQTSNEPLKQLRASKEDSCKKILKNAMKRHGLNDQDWRQYVLVICYGDQERPLELDETPVTIFKTLKQQGLHPSIMLRRRGDFEELMINGNHSSSNNIHSGEFNTVSPMEYSATPGGRL